MTIRISSKVVFSTEYKPRAKGWVTSLSYIYPDFSIQYIRGTSLHNSNRDRILRTEFIFVHFVKKNLKNIYEKLSGTIPQT